MKQPFFTVVAVFFRDVPKTFRVEYTTLDVGKLLTIT